METPRPIVGIGLMIVRDGKILMSRRTGSHGDGEFGWVGGKMEMHESFRETVMRELAEEAGKDIKVKNIRFLCLTNVRQYWPQHYIDIGMVADWVSGEARQNEPNKMGPWQWYDIDKLPAPLFGAGENYIEAYKTGKNFFDDFDKAVNYRQK
jgi:8-oxo-dGTP diphosphatase